jgi:hypothetical protein
MSKSYTVIICGQEVEVTVIDPVEVDRTRQGFLSSGEPVMPIGLTSFTDKDGEDHQHNSGYRKAPLKAENQS